MSKMVFKSYCHLFRQYALTTASISGAVINLIIIMILGRLYEIIAYKLTQWGLWILYFKSNSISKIVNIRIFSSW